MSECIGICCAGVSHPLSTKLTCCITYQQHVRNCFWGVQPPAQPRVLRRAVAVLLAEKHAGIDAGPFGGVHDGHRCTHGSLGRLLTGNCFFCFHECSQTS